MTVPKNNSNLSLFVLIHQEENNSIWDSVFENHQAHIEQTVLTTFETETSFLKHISPLTEMTVNIVLTTDRSIQKLNHQYRGKNTPTNVLAFPSWEEEELTAQAFDIGDVFLSYETIKKESTEQNKAFFDHFLHLIVHGCLHLIDYDHQTKEEAEEMEELEIVILEKLGIANPYDSME